MKTLLAILLCFSLYTISFGQLPPMDVCLGTDATVCQGQEVNISRCIGDAGSGLYLDNPFQLTFGDDQYSPTVNIGFNFNFYGTNYSQMILGDNGIVSFDVTQANAYCSWMCAPMPNTLVGATNSIALSWQDLYFPFAGGLIYQTIGTAPNRQFVISYENVSYFSPECQTPADCFTASIVLTEGTNTIDMFISNKSFCLAWNNGLAVQGIQNATGTNAVIVPGRNNTAWGAQLEGKRFTPINATTYNLSTIPFVSVTSAISTTTQWVNTLGETFPYVNGTPLAVTNVPSGTTGYFLSAATCGVAIGSVSDTTFITRLNSSVSASMTPDACNLSIGTATATPLTGNGPYSYIWSTGATTQTITGLVQGTYTVVMTTVELCPSTASVVVTSPTIIYSATSTLVSCKNGTNGTATATMTPSAPGLTYLWNDPANQTTQTATNLSAGVYNCTISTANGCVGTAEVTVTEIPALDVSIANQVDVSCHGGMDGIIELAVTQGTPGYTYIWDKSTSTTNIANDLSLGLNTALVTDVNGCTTTISAMVGEPNPLSITTLTPSGFICPENSITLSVTGTGGSSLYTYIWTANGIPIGTGTSVTVDPENDITEYCVKMTEACGSIPDDSCLTLTFPPAITPALTPNILSACTPARFEFTNNSTPVSEIATTEFDFGNGSSILELLSDSTSYTYHAANEYTITMTVTSIHGCVYTAIYTNLVESLPIPTASFNILNNPATIFETTTQMQENSSSDVIQWNWSSPFSSNTSSTNINPSFNFPDGEVGIYPITLYVTTADGCTDSIVKEFMVISDVIFYAPNAFTPDGDDHNQTWKVAVDGIDLNEFELTIYNRWGEKVWESKDATNEWDGRYKGEMVSDGAYNWIATVKELYSDKKHLFTGSLSLLR